MIITCTSDKPGVVMTQIQFSAEEVRAALDDWMATKHVQIFGPRSTPGLVMRINATGAAYRGDERFGDALRYHDRTGTIIDEV